MIDGVHGNTTSLGPAVALDSELVLCARSLQERFVCTATTGDDADHATGTAGDDLLGARRELDAGLALVVVVSDDGDVVAGGTAERTTVTNLLLDVGDDGTLGDGRQREDVADGESGVLAGVDELAGVHALVGDEGLGVQLVAVRVAELDAGERSTTTGVVDDLLHDTADVSMALREVEGTERGSSNPGAVDGLEDATSTFTLISDLDENVAVSSTSPSSDSQSHCADSTDTIIEQAKRLQTTIQTSTGGSKYLQRDPS